MPCQNSKQNKNNYIAASVSSALANINKNVVFIVLLRWPGRLPLLFCNFSQKFIFIQCWRAASSLVSAFLSPSSQVTTTPNHHAYKLVFLEQPKKKSTSWALKPTETHTRVVSFRTSETTTTKSRPNKRSMSFNFLVEACVLKMMVVARFVVVGLIISQQPDSSERRGHRS